MAREDCDESFGDLVKLADSSASRLRHFSRLLAVGWIQPDISVLVCEPPSLSILLARQTVLVMLVGLRVTASRSLSSPGNSVMRTQLAMGP